MDSMRSLNKSLPRSSAKQPPEQLLSAFKAAALSVTNLYKRAAAEEDQARRQGYQEALDELLHFLDKESLGLGDGEGWKVRQWATERYSGLPPVMDERDSDEDGADVDISARGTSPTIRHKSSRDDLSITQAAPSTSPTRTVSTASQSVPSIQSLNSEVARPEIFTFTTPIAYPQEVEMQTLETGEDTKEPQLQPHVPSSTSPPTSTARVGFVPRGTRTAHRSAHRITRHNTRSAHSTRSLGPGAGSKRGLPFGDFDFFDIGGPGDKDSPGGGGKRGRTG